MSAVTYFVFPERSGAQTPQDLGMFIGSLIYNFIGNIGNVATP
jgi:hypothetical protein